MLYPKWTEYKPALCGAKAKIHRNLLGHRQRANQPPVLTRGRDLVSSLTNNDDPAIISLPCSQSTARLHSSQSPSDDSPPLTLGRPTTPLP